MTYQCFSSILFTTHIVIVCIYNGFRKDVISVKLEKLSDTRIRCTLNRDDLDDRELRISELAYGSEKAKALFRDMMQQAACEFGFEAEDIPIMIEAIPISPDCLILDITKVEDPDELDTRFSNFTPTEDKEDSSEDTNGAFADEILNCFEQIADLMNNGEEKENKQETEKKETLRKKKNSKVHRELVKNQNSPMVRIFSFESLNSVCALARVLVPFYQGKNTLYKDSKMNRYYLCITLSQHTPEEFNKVCNLASEFGRIERTSYASLSYFEEHYDKIVSDNALQVLTNY